jgi:hypothetical protein
MKKIVLLTATILTLTIVSCTRSQTKTDDKNSIDSQECMIDTQTVKKGCDTTVCKDTLKK